MQDLGGAKNVVRSYYDALDAAMPETVAAIVAARVTPDYRWRGMHPFDQQEGAEAVAGIFWQPFLTAFAQVQRRLDVFMAGFNEVDGGETRWVGSMGHLLGLFDRPWLGIRPTGKIAMLRYAEFHRVEGDRIAETAMFVDIVHLMQQCGVNPLPPQTGASLIQPGPMTHDGVMFGAADPNESQVTLALINAMRTSIDFSGRGDDPHAELARCWHDAMIWWGPGGIGATYTIDRYIEQHQAPFRSQLHDRTFNGHLCRFAEGAYGGFFGWPNLTMTPGGGFLGMPASATPADMRVIDIYRRDGDKLAENWVFIDILHFLAMQGLDVLGRSGQRPEW